MRSATMGFSLITPNFRQCAYSYVWKNSYSSKTSSRVLLSLPYRATVALSVIESTFLGVAS